MCDADYDGTFELQVHYFMYEDKGESTITEGTKEVSELNSAVRSFLLEKKKTYRDNLKNIFKNYKTSFTDKFFEKCQIL